MGEKISREDRRLFIDTVHSVIEGLFGMFPKGEGVVSVSVTRYIPGEGAVLEKAFKTKDQPPGVYSVECRAIKVERGEKRGVLYKGKVVTDRSNRTITVSFEGVGGDNFFGLLSDSAGMLDDSAWREQFLYYLDVLTEPYVQDVRSYL